MKKQDIMSFLWAASSTAYTGDLRDGRFRVHGFLFLKGIKIIEDFKGYNKAYGIFKWGEFVVLPNCGGGTKDTVKFQYKKSNIVDHMRFVCHNIFIGMYFKGEEFKQFFILERIPA